MPNVDNNGRIYYVEPNDIDNLTVNGIPYNYEDYVLDVDLDVVLSTRTKCGSGFKGKNTILHGQLKPSKQSVYGDKHFFTTDYTEVKMYNTETNTTECLGLESLHITYESWMVPQISAKFIDVRGASLMSPMEDAYNRGVRENPDDTRKLTGGSFFKALFTFPYPMFILKVKGFYGRRVCYNLTVEDVKSEFNSETGNFEINVKFIGYLYRALTDIPMSYLTIAPYLNYNGKNYWQSSNFTYDLEQNKRGPKIMTFPELRKAIAEKSSDLRALLGSSLLGTTITNSTNEKDELEKIQKAFNNFLDDLFKNRGSSVRIPLFNDKETRYYGFSKSYIGDEQVVEDLNVNKKYKDLVVLINNFNNRFTDKQVNAQFELIKYKLDIPLKSTEELTWEIIYNYLGIKSNTYPKTSPDRQWYSYFILRTNNFEKQIENLIDACESEVGKAEEELPNTSNMKFGEILGFYPSIGNAYKTVHAHADTFMSAFYECLNNISKSSGRSLNDLKELSIKDTDLEQNFNASKSLYPFTGMYKRNNSGKELAWPGDFTGGENFEEVKFVNALLNAGKMSQEAIEEAYEKEREAYEDTSGSTDTEISATDGWYAILPNDFINGNPYKFLKDYNDTDIDQYVYLTLLLRLLYFNNYFKECTVDDCYAFSEIEAYNFYNAVGDTYKNVYTKILNKNNIDNLINIFTSNDTDKEYIHIIDKPFNTAVINNKNYDYIWGKHKLADNTIEHYLPIKYNKKYKEPKTGEEYIIFEGTNRGYTGKTFFIKEDNIDDYIFSIENSLKGNRYSTKNLLKLMGSDGETTRDTYEGIKTHDPKIWGGINSDGTYNTVLNLYGTDLFYAQNDINDLEKRLLAKAFLFINSYGYEYRYKFGDINKTRYDNILRIGSLCWRKGNKNNNGEWEEVINIPNGYKKATQYQTYIIDNIKKVENERFFTLLSDSENYKYSNKFDKEYATYSYSKINELKNIFIEWAKNEFPLINNKLELQLKSNNGLINTSVYNDLIKLTSEDIKSKLLFFPYNGIHIYGTNKKNISLGSIIYDEFLQQTLAEEKIGLNTIYIANDLRYSTLFNEDGNGYHYCTGDDTKDYFTIFCETLQKLFKDSKPSDNISNTISNYNDKTITRSQQISTYYTLKNLYDKWIASTEPSEWKLGAKNSIFNSFRYIDSYYKNIKDTIFVNIKDFSELGSRVTPCSNVSVNSDTGEKSETIYEGMSMYEFLSSVAEKTKGILLAYPVGSSLNEKDDGQLKDMFTPLLPWGSDTKDEKSSFIFLYGGIPSAHLSPYDDNRDENLVLNEYANDGFNVANANGKIIKEVATDLGTNDDDYTIPVFGVSYAKQNQSIFKKVSVGMSSAQVTEASIAATLHIANQGSQGPREFTLYGQDLYSIYSNYSYTCEVEMMGNAQIMPMLCFQLNNIPLFKGVYQIIKVEHDIVAGNMTTKFTGVRVNKYEVPKVDDSLNSATWTSSNFVSTNYRSMIYGLASDKVTDAARKEGIAAVAVTQLNRVTQGTYEEYGLQMDYWKDLGFNSNSYASSAWCATFVSWCCLQCKDIGYPNVKATSCLAWENFGNKNNCIYYVKNGNYKPQRDDIVLYKKMNDEITHHVGIVVNVDSSSTKKEGIITDISGNYSNSVKKAEKKYSTSYSSKDTGNNIYAFIHIDTNKSYDVSSCAVWKTGCKK